jgi:hypothetical protein
MPHSTGLTPSTLGRAVQDAIGSIALPGLNPVESVVLMYALLWFIPVGVCMGHVWFELKDGLGQRYRESGMSWCLAGAVSVKALLVAVGLYGLSALSLLQWGNLPLVAEMPHVAAGIRTVAHIWWTLMPSPGVLRLPPAAVLASALCIHILAEIVRWLSAHTLRVERKRRTRAVLSQLEAQQAPPPEERRGPIQYW